MAFLNSRRYRIAPDDRGFEPEDSVACVFDWAVFASVCLLLAFGPLAFGAVQEWAICTLEVGAAVCVSLWAVRTAASGTFEVHRNALFGPIILFAGLVCLQLLSGHTAYWYVTWVTALLWAAYGMTFFVVTQCVRRTAQIKAFALCMTVFGVMVALFAMVQQFTWNGKLYWVVPNRYGASVYGPYVNHAHYAGLMEMLAPIPLVFAMAHYWRKPFRVLFGFAALLMTSTIFLSHSLGGIVAFVAQVVFLAILVGQRNPSRRQVLLLLLLGVLLGAWLLAISPGGLAERIALLRDPLGKAGGGNRLAIIKDGLKMITERPLVGWGLGTFPVVYPSFRSFYTNFFVNEAHNDYLQAAVETGLWGFALVCCYLALFYRSSLRNIEHWRTDIRSGVCLAAIVGVTGILVHSLSDFNLQIPANASLFFALCALATGNFGNRARLARPGPAAQHPSRDHHV
jgi:O-antigen ligase